MTLSLPHITRGMLAVILSILIGSGGVAPAVTFAAGDGDLALQEAVMPAGLPAAQAAKDQRDWSRIDGSSAEAELVGSSKSSSGQGAAAPAVREEPPQVRPLFLDFLQLRL